MKGTVWIALSIVAAGALIAGAVLVRPNASVNAGGAPTPAPDRTVEELGLRPLSDDDHVRGNPEAHVAIVEFSDFECPFCQRLHPTLTRIIEESGDEVAWVYRHFPLTQIHPNAMGSAIASECVAQLGGNEAFWTFADTIFENQHDLSAGALERYAQQAGVSADSFRSCISDDTMRRDVLTDGSEAQRAGGLGTPFGVIITRDGDALPFSGALPYQTIRGLVDSLL